MATAQQQTWAEAVLPAMDEEEEGEEKEKLGEARVSAGQLAA